MLSQNTSAGANNAGAGQRAAQETPATPQSGKEHVEMPFGKVNFIMMAGCLLLIITGFLLMSGGGDANETTFNPEIFSTRRIVVGPTLTFLGFLFMAFAIIWKKKK